MAETKKNTPLLGASCAEYRQTLTEIRTDRVAFRLNEPVSVSFLYEDGLWYCESKELSILSFGKSKEEALEAFCEDFSAVWDVIAQSADESLTPSALRVKRAMLHAVDLVAVE